MSVRDDLKKLVDAGLVPEGKYVISLALHQLPHIDSGEDAFNANLFGNALDILLALAVSQAEQVVTLREAAEAARRDACSLEFDLGLARSELRRLQQKLGALEAKP